MRKKELSALVERLLPYLPGFTARANLFCHVPVTHTLKGVVLDRSIDPRAFYAQVFVQPLFVPCEHLVFNMGWRVGNGSWDADTPGVIEELGPALAREVVAFLTAIETPADIISAAYKLHREGDSRVQEAMAFALAKAGRHREARQALSQVAAGMNREINWQREVAERAEMLGDKLRQTL